MCDLALLNLVFSQTEAAEELQQVTRQRAAAEENTTVGTSSIRDSEQHCVAVPDDSCFDASNTVISKVLSNLFVVRKCARTSGELAPDEEVFSSNYEHLVAACGKVENEAKPAALLDICMSTVPPPSSSDFGNRHIRAIEDPFLVSSSASASSETTPDEGVSSGDNEHLASICEEVDSDAKPDTLLDMSTVHPTASSYEHVSATSMYIYMVVLLQYRKLLIACGLVPAQNSTPPPIRSFNSLLLQSST